MKIIKSFPETLNKRDAYRLTQAKSTKKMLDAAGSVLEPKCWVLSEDVDQNGEYHVDLFEIYEEETIVLKKQK